MQDVLEREMEECLHAREGERNPERVGYRSGYYERCLVTRVGTLELRVPQDREGRFGTEVFERYARSEKSLMSALTEMYVQGVSTRRVKAITEELCGHGFSACSVSRIAKRLDTELEQLARRRLEEARRDLAGMAWQVAGQIPKLCDWVEDSIEQTFSFYRLPCQHHRHVKSTNMLERFNQEIKRRTHIARTFPNGASCPRLVRALAVGTHEEWLEGARYLNMPVLKEHKKEQPRALDAA